MNEFNHKIFSLHLVHFLTYYLFVLIDISKKSEKKTKFQKRLRNEKQFDFFI